MKDNMKVDNQLAEALRATLISPNEQDRNLEAANVVDGLFAIARAVDRLATQVKYLGNGDATDNRGAIEAFGMHIGEKMDALAEAITTKGQSDE